MIEPLHRDSVLVSRTPVPGPDGQGNQDHLLALLDAQERARCQRFRFEKDRWLYLVAHVLLRTTLAEAAALDPRVFRFRSGDHGRPEIDEPAAARHLRFNLTHAQGLAACVVARDLDVGIDAESLDREIEPGLPARYFSPAENAALNRHEGQAWQRAFFQIWTLKEAYLKARGLGLSIALDSFSFQVDGDAISFAGDHPAQGWHFHVQELASGHILALAMGPAPGRHLVIQEQVMPLHDLLAACRG
jgi:4'-phosphopantetheinyl transferase